MASPVEVGQLRGFHLQLMLACQRQPLQWARLEAARPNNFHREVGLVKAKAKNLDRPV